MMTEDNAGTFLNGVTILSYTFLPEGFLLKKNSVADFNTSKNVIMCAVQIFSYNMLSIVVVILGSLFASKNVWSAIDYRCSCDEVSGDDGREKYNNKKNQRLSQLLLG